MKRTKSHGTPISEFQDFLGNTLSVTATPKSAGPVWCWISMRCLTRTTLRGSQPSRFWFSPRERTLVGSLISGLSRRTTSGPWFGLVSALVPRGSPHQRLLPVWVAGWDFESVWCDVIIGEV